MTKHKVHFFAIDTFDRTIADNPTAFETVCQEIFTLPVAQKTLEMSDSVAYRLSYFQKTGDHYQGKIVKYRTNNMITGSLSDDALSDLTLEEGRAFAEVTHFIYSPETKVLSFEYNHNGPRYGMFLGYINAIQARYRADTIQFVADLLLHPDVAQTLLDAKRIKSLTVGLQVARIPAQIERSNLLRGLAAAAQFGDPGQVYVTISGSRGRGDASPLMSPEGIVRAIQNREIDLGLFGKAEVEVVTDFGSDTVNLLENKLEASKEWHTPITNHNAHRWFDDIKELYQRNKPVIDVALEAYA